MQRTFSILALLLHLLVSAGAAAERAAQRPPAQPGGNRGAGAAAPAQPGTFIQQAVPVRHWPASEMKKFLAPLVTPGGAVLDQPGEKSLVIVDSPPNIQRLMEIKELIDVPAFAGTRIDIFQPQAASAEELAAGTTELMRTYLSANSAAPNATLPVRLIPIPGTNQILAVSLSEDAWNAARRWLERVDGSAGSRRRIFIYPLEPAKTIEPGEKLSQLLSQGKDAGNSPAPTQGPPRIRRDAATNSLIVYGTAQEFQEIKNALNPGRQMEEFKQRLSVMRREIESSKKNGAPGG